MDYREPRDRLEQVEQSGLIAGLAFGLLILCSIAAVIAVYSGLLPAS